MEKKQYIKAEFVYENINIQDILFVSDPSNPETDIEGSWDLFD